MHGMTLEMGVEKCRQGQTLHVKEFAVLAGISYSAERWWRGGKGRMRQGLVDGDVPAGGLPHVQTSAPETITEFFIDDFGKSCVKERRRRERRHFFGRMGRIVR